MKITFELNEDDIELFKIMFTEGIVGIQKVFNQPGEKEFSTAFLQKMVTQVMKQTGPDWSGVLKPLERIIYG